MPGTPKLIILSEQFRGRTFELTKDQHTVGRVDERDICIKDPTISTYHCRFIKSDDSYIVEDQGSTNGTRVNNVPVMSQALQNSDIIQIGGVELLYDCDNKSVTTVIAQQTQTGIDVNAATTTQTIKRMGQQGFEKPKRNGGNQKMMLGIIVLLAVIVLALLGFLIWSMMNNQSASAPAPAPQIFTPAPVPAEQNVIQ